MASYDYLLPNKPLRGYIGARKNYSDSDTVKKMVGVDKLSDTKPINTLLGRRKVSSARIARMNYQRKIIS